MIVSRRFVSLRLPFEEVGNQGKAKLLALFRMELRAGLVAMRDKGSNWPAIVGHGHHVVGALAFRW